MSLRWSAPLLLAALAGSAQAQTERVLGKADADFATALLRAGYTDLAAPLCDVLLKKGSLEPDEAVGVKALHLDLRLELALRENDLIARKDLLAAILAEKEDLVRQYGGRKAATDTTATLPEVYQKLGETISLALQKETDAAKITQLQKEAADIFKAAEQKLTDRIAELENALAESETTNPTLENQLVAARYNLPRTQYFHALIFGKSDTITRDTLLDAAVLGFQEFGLEHGDTYFAYEGLIYEGLCYKEKEAYDDALTAFGDAIGLREGYPQDAKGYYDLGVYEADLVSWGVLQKVKLLLELGRTSEALEEAKVFWDTTPDAGDARHGLAILAQQAEAWIKAGDTQKASDAADKLVDLGRGGPWSAVGREMQGRLLAQGGPVDPEKVRRIAATLLERGELDQALRVARQGADAAFELKNADVGVDLWLLIGQIYQRREGDWSHEAAVAFDAAAERFPGSDKAAEAVYQASQIYSKLAREERKKRYKDRSAEAQRLLTTRYASHPRAARAQLTEAEDLAGEGKYQEAAELYARVPPTSSVYLDAQFGQGDCYFLQAREILSQKAKAGLAEARPLAEQAERLMRKAMVDADAAGEKTLDLLQRAQFDSIALRVRNRLAQLYLIDELGLHERVLPLLEGTDERFASNDEAISTFWNYRITALSRLGSLDQAVTLLDALIKRSPDSKAIGPAAGTLARALDRAADELRDQGKQAESDAQRRRAAAYYATAGRALLAAESPKVALIESTAKRLFAIGLEVNGVPEDQQTFIGWDPAQARDKSYWELASDLMGAALTVRPGYQLQILQGRAFGLLGNYVRAAGQLGLLFDQEKFYDAQKAQINLKLQRAKPELLYAYFEYGYAEHKAGVERQDAESLRRAQDVFAVMVRTLTPNERLWWWARYLQIKNAVEAGYYQDAGFLMNDLERTTSGYGAEYGLEPMFRALKNELK